MSDAISPRTNSVISVLPASVASNWPSMASTKSCTSEPLASPQALVVVMTR